PGVPSTIHYDNHITPTHTQHRPCSQTLTNNRSQTHRATPVLAVAQGVANTNTNGGTNLTVTATGAASTVNFGTTQTLKALAVDNNSIASLVSGAAGNTWGGKTLSVQSLSITGGAKLDATNNNLVID